TGKSLQKFDSSLWSTTLYKHANARYQKLIKARDFISDAYRIKIAKLKEIKERVICLETLAKSDLYWDPIVKIEKTESKHPYVYDLQVKNEVFLAGYGGLFVHNSYFVKLEALRSLMTGTEAIIIDPESEYKTLADAVGGEYISFSFNAPAKINPFDLAQIREEGENQLGIKILSLHSLMKVIMGVITPTQEAMLDRALIMTYRNKGITMDPDTQGKEPPLMEDLYKTLIGMEVPDALDLAARIEKFVRGSFVGIFDKQTNINITNPFTVFSVKDLQETLRPIAMFIILDYIWTRVKKDIKKRILIVDEAWHMMKYPDTAQFLWSVVKRARKYYLGLTTITQDVEDFLGQDIGKAIVTNSALQVLLKQSPAAIDKIGEVFYLSQGEKNLLLAANVGEGIFFAGPHHAPIRVVASTEEDKLITTKPLEVAKVNPNAYEAK
ncbi:MAG: Type IV secretory pathway VirB4 component-like protein, partial [Microgenomates group bacterium GW2011_GWC1_39_7b]